jgi:hypothetical protein
MFKTFGFGGVKCPRCDHASADSAGYCVQCGMTLGAPRHAPVLRENRWIPSADELAVFFGVRELKGIFTKTLHVPATTRAYILQNNKATEVPQGEYEIEGFFTRLNNLLRDQHAEILITRQTAFPIEFAFENLHTAEFLKLGARFTLSVKIDNITAFAQYFMTMPGAITSSHLHDLLSPLVRQVIAEFTGAQSMREMAANRDLRPQLDERLQAMLTMRLAQYGLAVVQVDTLALQHDKWDANREKLGTLWLIADAKRVQLAYTKEFDQLYSDTEWQRITREEEQVRLRYRRGELAQDESEQLQTLRAREIELYGRIVEADSRKQAIERGAGDTLKALEHTLAKQAGQRDLEALQWPQLRALAQIKMRAELEITQLEAKESVVLAQQRVGHQLHQLQLQNQIEQAERIESDGARRAESARLLRQKLEAGQRASQLQNEEHQAHLLTLAQAKQVRLHEARRLQEWEDELHLIRRRELLRGEALQAGGDDIQIAELQEKAAALRRAGASADAIAQQEKLLRTVEAKGVYERQELALRQRGMQDALDIDEQRLRLKQQEEEARWQRESQRQDQERAERLARWQGEQDQLLARQAHETALARLAMERITVLESVGDTTKVAVADIANAALLADILKTQVQAGMSAEQIQAARQAYTVEQTNQMVEQRLRSEREQRDADTERERRHLLEMLQLQNAAHGHALSSQMQLGVGVAGGQAPRVAGAPVPVGASGAQAGVVKHCFKGHANQVEARFCAECGAPLV